jgi:hypothetical protein
MAPNLLEMQDVALNSRVLNHIIPLRIRRT